MENSQTLASQLATYDKSVQNPVDVYNSALNKLGISDARTRVTDLRQSLVNNQNLLDNLSGNIQGRTSDSLVSEAQRQRLYATEAEPIVKMGNQLNNQFGMAEGDYQNIMAEGKTQADLTVQGQQAKRQALLDRLNVAIQNETNTEKKRQWQAEFDSQMKQLSQQQANWQKEYALNVQKFNADTNPSKPTLDESLKWLDTMFVAGDNSARFVSGYNKDGTPQYMTREQAAAQVAYETGVDKAAVLKEIYSRFKNKKGK